MLTIIITLLIICVALFCTTVYFSVSKAKLEKSFRDTCRQQHDSYMDLFDRHTKSIEHPTFVSSTACPPINVSLQDPIDKDYYSTPVLAICKNSRGHHYPLVVYARLTKNKHRWYSCYNGKFVKVCCWREIKYPDDHAINILQAEGLW